MVVVEELTSSLNLGSSLAFFLAALTTVLTIYHFWFQSLRYVKLGNKIPGLSPLPILGDAYIAFNRDPKEIMDYCLEEIKQRQGATVLRVWFGNRLGVILADPRDIELILGSNKHLEKSPEYDFFEPWLGDGLLISNGDKWRAHRKMIAPTFHQSILKTFLPTFNKNANELVKQLRENVVGEICDIHDYLSGATVDVLLETVMGVQKTKEAKSSFEYAKAVMELTKMFKEQIKHLNIIHSLSDKVIKARKSEYFERLKDGGVSLYRKAVEEAETDIHESSKAEHEISNGSTPRDDLDEEDDDIGEKKRLAFLDFMVEASQTEGNKLNDEGIRDEVNTIMFEGHDTTAAASSFFICMLGVHPDIQEKVYQEMREIFKDSDRPVTFLDTLQMKYLERVLLETLRMFPPVPVITRIIREEIKLVSADYILPKDTTVAISPFIMHRKPEHYPNPEKFDPDNFLPERCQQRPYYAFIPFSAGPRSCVGRKYAMLKLKVLLSAIVRNFKIESVVGAEDFQLQGDIILKRADGFRVILENRK